MHDQYDVATVRHAGNPLAECYRQQLTWPPAPSRVPVPQAQEVPADLPGLITEAAARRGAPAIVEPGRADLSYSHLAAAAQDLAQVLRRIGVSRTDRVATVLPAGAASAFGFLAVAGAAVAAPLNPAYRREELEFYLNDLRAALVVVGGEVPGCLHDAAASTGVRLAELTDDLVLQPVGRPGTAADDEPARPDATALVLHTSGTTGRPKAVPLTHANLCFCAATVARSMDLTQADRCLNLMPLFHIHGLVAGLLAPLAAGGASMCVAGFDPGRVVDWFGLGATWYTAVPAVHQAVLDSFDLAGRPQTRLRFIRSCSSALPPTLMSDLEQAFRVPVVEAYGMTEAAHQIAVNPLPPGIRKPGSVGQPSGAQVRVLDAQGAVAPAGVRGEVVIRGAGVTSGYQDRETNEKAFADGWLRTGDEGCLDADGYLFLTGRLKELINRGGEKIAPREVEEALLCHPAVAGVAVFAVPDATLGEEVGAAIVQRPGHAVDAAAIRRHVRDRLAHFKVPRHVLFVDEIPKGPTGKVRRIGLAAKLGIDGSATGPLPRPPYRPARTQVERTISELFEEMLAVERIGLDDDFMALGGDSIQAARVIAEIKSRHGVALRVADVFDGGTPERIAVVVVTQSASGVCVPKLVRRGGDARASRNPHP